MIDELLEAVLRRCFTSLLHLRIAAKVEPFNKMFFLHRARATAVGISLRLHRLAATASKPRDALGVEFSDSQHRIRTRVLLLGFEVGVFQWLRNDAVFT